MKQNKLIFYFCAIILSLGTTQLVFAQELGEIEVDVLYNNGDIADYSGIKFVVYQTAQSKPILEKEATSNPEKLQLPINQDYKIEVYSNDMFSAFKIVKLDSKKKDIDINIPLSGGLQIQVLYDDKQTPVSDATVVIKSHKGNEWRKAQTNDNGNTLRFWIQSTTSPDNYYQADVYLGDTLVKTSNTIKLEPGISTDVKIILPVPKIVDDLITVSLYKNSNKVTKDDGDYAVILQDQSGNKQESKVNIRGDAHFSLLKPSKYTIIVVPPTNEQGLWPENNVFILGKQNQFNVFMDPIPEQVVESEPKEDILSCDCVAFRLDDVQDFWLNSVQIGIMEQFVQNKLPLTVGIISDSFGNDQTLTEYIKTNKMKLEIASHGVGTTPFTEYDKQTQDKLVKQSIGEIKTSLGITPKVFIPPQNRVNQDTTDALINNGFTHLSGSILHGATPPFPLKDQLLYNFPEVATTGQYDPQQNVFVGVNSNQTVSDAVNGIESFGFAVITMHPQEFSVLEDGVYANKINDNQIEQLQRVIDQLQSKGYKLVPIGKINLDSNVVIPSWVKNNAGWWSENKIDDKTFISALQYLIQEKIIVVPQTQQASQTTSTIPVWIKNNAGWWATNQISDTDFVKGIEFLIANGIIKY